MQSHRPVLTLLGTRQITVERQKRLEEAGQNVVDTSLKIKLTSQLQQAEVTLTFALHPVAAANPCPAVYALPLSSNGEQLSPFHCGAG